MQHDHVLKKLNFDLLTPSPGWGRGWVSVGKMFATMLLHFVIPFDLICNMTSPATQQQQEREHSGSAVEHLTRNREAAGLSLTSVTGLWSLSKTHLS